MKNTNIVEIPLTSISPHPDNPRKDLGDLTELADSIRTTGILQNLTVVQNEDYTYTVIIGHRRLAAAKLAGLTTVPCVVTEMTAEEQLATMLAENMQRSDLTVYEQAEGIQLLLDHSFSVADISEKTGLSQSTIRRRTKLLELDKDSFARSQQRQVSLSDYEKLNEIEDIDVRNRLLDTLGTNNFNNEFEKAKRNQTENQKRQILIHYLESLSNARALKIKKAKTWEYITTIFSEKEAHKYIKADREYCYEVSPYGSGVHLYRKRTETEIEHNRQEEKRHETRDIFLQEGRMLNETTRNLRQAFVKDPPKLNNEQYMILVKEFLRSRLMPNYYVTPECLNGSKSNFDDVYEIDSGVKIMLELIWNSLDGRFSPSYISSSLDSPYNVNENLNTLYFLLTRLGYEMSDEEKQLRDGTHPIFTKYKENK